MPVGSIELIGRVAVIALETARAVAALRKAGMQETARKLELECNLAVQALITTTKRRRAAAAKARAARR